ncbi:MAG: NAD(P)-binding domain-containing protein [Spirochaetales bacterium]|nr:NAD(P)-binding domain-containing protein [Spirochaetales bacterium]
MNSIIQKEKFGFIGCGHLGFAFVQAFLNSGFPRENIHISYSGRKSTHEKLTQAGLKDCLSTNDAILINCDYIFLFVRPDQLGNIDTSHTKKDALIISSLAGVSIGELSNKFQKDIIRLMPTNPDSIVSGSGICALYPEATKIKALLHKLKIGLIPINKESGFHCFTALSVLPAIILQSELLSVPVDKKKILSEYPGYTSIIEWAFSHVPSALTKNEKISCISKTATPGGITEAMIFSFKNKKSIMDAIRDGIKRSQQIEEGLS